MLFSRLGVYLPLPGVDVKAFQQSVQTGGGLLGYIDTLSGGSISRVGVFSLGRSQPNNLAEYGANFAKPAGCFEGNWPSL